jgi:integrase
MGGIYSRTKADGSVVYSHLYFADGRQHDVTLKAKTVAAARKEAATRNVKKDSGELAAPSKRTVGQVKDEFFALQDSLVQSGELRPRTVELYKQRWRSHLEERLENRVLQKVTGNDISAVIAEMRRKDLSPSLISGTLMVAGMIFSFAVEKRYIVATPMAQLARRERPQAKPRTEPRVLNLEEIDALVSKAPGSIRDYLLFVAFTGVRMSEGLALRWCDVDLESGTAQITGQLERKTFRRIPTKTTTGNREIFLTDELVTMLKARRVKALERGLHGAEHLVFCTKTGSPLSHRNVARAIRTAGDNAGLNGEGLQPVSCHDLRHSAISRMIANGVDVATTAQLAGDKVATVVAVYAHHVPTPGLRERVTAAVGGAAQAAGGGA